VKPRTKRLIAILGGLAALGAATALVLSAFQENLVFFFTPTQVAANEAPKGRLFRIGGMVEKGSVQRSGVEVRFVVTDTAKTIPVVFFHEPQSKLSIGLPIPDITPMNPPLGLVPPLPPKIVKLDETAHLSAPEALMAGIAYAGQNSDSVFGTGRLDVAKYGRLLKSRQLVGVRGAGVPFDGLFFVKSVTHEIKRGEYKQSFSLARNALVSTVPTVPV